jgi:hypothetical protein
VDREALDRIDKFFLQPNQALFEELDCSIQGSRGPRLLTSRTLLGGLVYLGMASGTKTLTKLERLLKDDATQGQLQLLMGVAPGPLHQHREIKPPSRDRLYRVYKALARGFKREGQGREIFGEHALQDALRKLSCQLLESSAPTPPARAEFTVDTTDIWAACRTIRQSHLQGGQRAADPDARWRVKARGELDPDAPARKARSEKWAPENKLVFGYGGIAIGGTHDNYGYVYGCDLIPADKYDVPVSLRILDELLAAGQPIGELIADKGFSGGQPWLNGVRRRGVMPIFDLKEGQGDENVMWKGCLVLQGWPYLPQLPKKLWCLHRPGLQAPAKKWKQFRDDITERQKYALVSHGYPTPTSARVTSPIFRNRRIACERIRFSKRNYDPELAVCPGDHGDDEACCIRSATFKVESAPLAYQYPIWGTPAWEEKYAKRTNVERGFSTLKNPDVVGFRPGLFRIRTLVKVSMLVACMFVAHNLLLRKLDEGRRAKGWIRPARRQRRTQSAVPGPQATAGPMTSSPPAAPSRAP